MQCIRDACLRADSPMVCTFQVTYRQKEKERNFKRACPHLNVRPYQEDPNLPSPVLSGESSGRHLLLVRRWLDSHGPPLGASVLRWEQPEGPWLLLGGP